MTIHALIVCTRNVILHDSDPDMDYRYNSNLEVANIDSTLHPVQDNVPYYTSFAPGKEKDIILSDFQSP